MSNLLLFFGIMCPMMTIALCKNFGIKLKESIILKMDFNHDLWIKMGEKVIPYPTCPFNSISPTKYVIFCFFQSYPSLPQRKLKIGKFIINSLLQVL
jgi:hypothetical protein